MACYKGRVEGKNKLYAFLNLGARRQLEVKPSSERFTLWKEPVTIL
jgi:hypothetical protein